MGTDSDETDPYNEEESNVGTEITTQERELDVEANISRPNKDSVKPLASKESTCKNSKWCD